MHRPDPDDVLRQRDEIRQEDPDPASDVVPAADEGAPTPTPPSSREAESTDEIPDPIVDDAGPEPARPGPDPDVVAGSDRPGAPPAEPAASAVNDPDEPSPVNRDL